MKQPYRVFLTLAAVATLAAPACVRSAEKAAPVPKSPSKGAVAPPRTGKGTEVAPVLALPAWKEATGYDFFLAGVEDGAARVFQSPDYQRLLVVPGGGELIYLLALKSRVLETLPRASVSLSPDGATPASEGGTAAGSFAQEGSEIRFKSALGEARLAPEPPIIGSISLESLLEKKPEYVTLARQYSPNGAAISLLRSSKQPLEIAVFFGTWCSYCKKWLPAFIRTIQETKNPAITVRYYGVDEDLSQPEAELTKYAIRKTPTFVVLSGGKEIGRITEEPTKSMEQDLSLILFNGGQ